MTALRPGGWPRAGAVVAILILAAAGRAQEAVPPELLTRAERTGFVETSRYDDVVALLDALADRAPGLHRLDYGFSYEGRALPLAVWSPGVERGRFATLESLRVPDRTRVLVFANIHAGEVEGKEAALMILRDLTRGAHPAWADSLLVIVAPIYNADGNERVTLTNRPLQHGPIGGMGQRVNAMGLDLNRDFMKLEAPEARSLVGLLRDADPHVVLDLHTTNGTIHGYHLTYAPPLHPATDPSIDAYLRETLLPAVTRAVAPRWSLHYYGNLPEDEGLEAERGWYTFDARPRFSNNYAGLRNRFGILSEAYAYLPFDERVAVTKEFVEATLDFAWANASEIRRLTAAADAAPLAGREMPLRGRIAPSTPGPIDILLGEVEAEPHPYTGQPMLRRLAVQRPERMPEFGRFQASETTVAPTAYVVPAGGAATLDRLRAHGIRTEVVGVELPVEEFRITSSRVAAEEFQGHRERTIEGEWQALPRPQPAGSLVVPLDQPLARLAVMLLDPRSDDGLAAWNLLDDALEGAEAYPILRTRAPLPGRGGSGGR